MKTLTTFTIVLIAAFVVFADPNPTKILSPEEVPTDYFEPEYSSPSTDSQTNQQQAPTNVDSSAVCLLFFGFCFLVFVFVFWFLFLFCFLFFVFCLCDLKCCAHHFQNHK